MDLRVVESVRTEKFLTKDGIVVTPDDVGGWPSYRADAVALDSDGDGMPDEWERRHGLNPNDPGDAAQDTDGDGYTNLEEYLNGTDPRQFIDYTRPENNGTALHARAKQ